MNSHDHAKRCIAVAAFLAFGALVFLATFAGCASTQPPAPSADNPCGIERFSYVSSAVVRSAQPTGAQWRCLQQIGVKHVAMLNFPGEGTDDGAAEAGIEVVDLAIDPRTDAMGLDEIRTVLVRPDPAAVERLDAVIHRIAAGTDGLWLIHCVHGRDRTGFAVGRYRVLAQHWSKADAFKEMVDRGFRWVIPGLMRAWEEFDP